MAKSILLLSAAIRVGTCTSLGETGLLRVVTRLLAAFEEENDAL